MQQDCIYSRPCDVRVQNLWKKTNLSKQNKKFMQLQLLTTSYFLVSTKQLEVMMLNIRGPHRSAVGAGEDDLRVCGRVAGHRLERDKRWSVRSRARHGAGGVDGRGHSRRRSARTAGGEVAGELRVGRRVHWCARHRMRHDSDSGARIVVCWSHQVVPVRVVHKVTPAVP